MKKTTTFKYQKNNHSIFEVFANKKPIEEGKKTDISLANLIAISAIKSGKGVEEHLHTLAYSVNMCLILSEMGYGDEFVEDIKNAQYSVVRTIKRLKATGKIGFSGSDMIAIQDIISLVDEQIALATKAEIEKASMEIRRRLKLGETLQ